MVTKEVKVKSIDLYLLAFPHSVQSVLQKLRSVIRKAAPLAEETINYGIPTFKLNGNLVHFAGYKNHIGFYPTPGAIVAFKKELSKYKSAKGSVQFPIDEPLPVTLIAKIVKFRVKENALKAKDTKASASEDDSSYLRI